MGTKISELTAASALDGTEQVAIVQGGTTKRTTVDEITTAATGVLFDLDTTVTTGVAGTTECEGESGPAGTAPAGTLTPTANVASAWMASTKLIEFAANASHAGIHVRRIITGTLPAEGYILDVGIGHVDALFSSHGVVMFGYQQNTGAAFTGLGLYFSDAGATLSMMAVGDDGSGAPYTPVDVVAAPAFANALGTFDRGPVRVVVEFRKLDTQTPAEWLARVTVTSQETTIASAVFSGVSSPKASFSTSVEMDGWAPDKIGVGVWNKGAAEDAVIRLSHLRVYSLGSAVPA